MSKLSKKNRYDFCKEKKKKLTEEGNGFFYAGHRHQKHLIPSCTKMKAAFSLQTHINPAPPWGQNRGDLCPAAGPHHCCGVSGDSAGAGMGISKGVRPQQDPLPWWHKSRSNCKSRAEGEACPVTTSINRGLDQHQLRRGKGIRASQTSENWRRSTLARFFPKMKLESHPHSLSPKFISPEPLNPAQHLRGQLAAEPPIR